jgi:hypothetical protein
MSSKSQTPRTVPYGVDGMITWIKMEARSKQTVASADCSKNGKEGERQHHAMHP